jgi:putative ABC transport system permease protein
VTLPPMVKVAVRSAGSHPVRLVATALAVLLSVAFMAGTRVLGDTVRTSLGEVWSDAYASVDVVVRSSETAGLDERARLDAGLVERVATVDGVSIAEGSLQSDLPVLGSDGEALRDAEVGAANWVLSWPDQPGAFGWEVLDGRAPAAPGEAVVDAVAAREGLIELGETVAIVVGGEVVPAAVVGEVAFQGGSAYAGTPSVLVDEGWLGELLGQPGTVDRIDVVASPGTSPDELAARLAGIGGEGSEVVTGAQLSAEERAEVGEVVDLFVQLVSAFGAIALFVGAFLIVNTFTIIVTQRTRELALLRALGASRRQVMGAVVVEAFLVAVVASVAGGAASLPVAVALRALVDRVGFTVPDTPLAIGWPAFATPVVLAVVVTCGAALVPAWRASRTAAVDAMRRASVEVVGRSTGRVVAGTVLAVAAAVLVLQATQERSDAATATVLVAAAPAVVAFALAGPVITPPVVSWLSAPLARTTGITGRLASRNALRNPGRTSSTAAALVIGVSLVVVISVASASLASTVSRVVGQTVQGDFVVTGASGVSIDVAPALADLPEVEAAAGIRLGQVVVGGVDEFVLAVDPGAAEEIVDLGVSEGSLDDLGPDGIAVARVQADTDGVALGDEVEVVFPFGARAPFTVAAVYEQALTRNGEYLFPHAGWDQYLPSAARVDGRVLVDLADDVDPDDAEPVLAAALERWPGVELLDVAAYRDQQVDQVVDRISFLYVLLALAVIVGLLGIANTLLLGVVERTRELGLLRTVGAAGRQLGSAVLQEAAVIAALGALVGVGLGLVLGWAMVQTLRFDQRITVDVPVQNVLGIGVLAVVAGVVAGLVPAWRAGRMPVLDAVAEE